MVTTVRSAVHLILLVCNDLRKKTSMSIFGLSCDREIILVFFPLQILALDAWG